MTQDFVAEPVLEQLTGFQRDTVEHVMKRFFRDPDRTGRFLVSDETGLGKTMVARGVVARTIEELQHDPNVDAIDILYICSNVDLAQQNLKKLSATSGQAHGIASRLTLLAKHMHKFRMSGTEGLRKQVNLISFTPGTSFSKGWASGTAEERAMLYLMLGREFWTPGSKREQRAGRLFQGTCQSVGNFLKNVEYLNWALAPQGGQPDEGITEAFLSAVRATPEGDSTLGATLDAYLDAGEADGIPGWTIVGELRTLLARVSAKKLTPDLIVLDEFQRFRDLLEPDTEAGHLAHHLFDHQNEDGGHGPKVLLLSATPFKAFTYSEEAESDDHHKDFLRLMNFLCSGDQQQVQAISDAMAGYRTAVTKGEKSPQAAQDVRHVLLKRMSRTERPRHLMKDMSGEILSTVGIPTAKDIEGFVAMRKLAQAVGAPFGTEYWKSAPYFANYMDTYKVGEKTKEALRDPSRRDEVGDLLSRTSQLDRAALEDFRPLRSLGNAKLEALAEETVGQDWWQLLWVPPAVPYLRPEKPFNSPRARSMTKRLVFSSWTATPSAVATLLSYEADRRAVAALPVAARGSDHRSRLDYRPAGRTGVPGSMSTLALFWPMPGPALAADPWEVRRENGEPVSRTILRQQAADRLRSHDPSAERGRPWEDLFRRKDILPDGLTENEILDALAGIDTEEHDGAPLGAARSELLRLHIQHALLRRDSGTAPTLTKKDRARVVEVATNSPANIAWRALRRISTQHPAVTQLGLWKAAAQLASAFHVLFRRSDTTRLLDGLYKGSGTYWEKVLHYCAAGNLQAVMDEYLHHLHLAVGAHPLDDESLAAIAKTAGDAIALRPATYELFDPQTAIQGESPEEDTEKFTLTVRFAQRYGGRREGQESARQPQLREAFNSPFWPFVLASTSVGQEGVDFHRYCHSVFHWNVPANPIDFEQREGRVDRHAGHAVRKNVAADFEGKDLLSDCDNPWTKLYELAQDRFTQLGDFSPFWCYLGEAAIERRIALHPLSSDGPQLERAKDNVAFYRMTFGQPRQEDMVALIARNYAADTESLEALRLNLCAPPRDKAGAEEVA